MMSSKEVTSYLEKIEKAAEIDNFKIKGINVWQIVRHHIFRSINSSKRKNTSSKKKLYRRVIEKALEIPLFLYRYFKIKVLDATKNSRLEKCDLFLLSTTWYRKVKINGMLSNPYTDPLYDWANNLDKKVIHYEYASNNDKFPYPRYYSSYLNQSAIIKSQLRSLITANISKKEQMKFRQLIDQLNELLKKLNLSARLDVSLLLVRISLFLHLRDEFHRILKRCEPKLVLIVCYYNYEGFAMISACRKLGIQTYDIQHGAQGPLHAAYGKRTIKGTGSIELLPDGYMVWSSREKEALQRMLTPHSRDIIVSGNNVAQFIREKTDDNFYHDARKIVEKSADRINVLISLQYGIGLNEIFLKLLEHHTDRFFWLVRLHPNMKEGEKNEIITELENFDSSSMEYKVSSSGPLYSLLPFVDVHITQFSSVVLDALNFNKRSIITSDKGKKLYKDLIKQGYVYHRTGESEIIDTIKMIKKTPGLSYKGQSGTSGKQRLGKML